MVFGKQVTRRGSVVSCSGAGGCVLRGLEKEMTLTFQRHIILEAQTMDDFKGKEEHLPRTLQAWDVTTRHDPPG